MVWKGGEEPRIYKFDVQRFPLREKFQKILNYENLPDLHVKNSVTANVFRTKVFEFQEFLSLNADEIQPIVDEIVEEIFVPVFGPVISLQKKPTFRCHYAVQDVELEEEKNDYYIMKNNDFLKKYYFDNYRPGTFHRDKDYGLLDGTINMWIPITDVFDTNSLWVGGKSLRGLDSAPLKMRYGEILFFDAANRWHGAIWNTSSHTRISFDVRVFPKSRLAYL